MASTVSNVKIRFTADATEALSDLNQMGDKTQALGVKLTGLSKNFKDLDRYVDESARGFSSFGSNSSKYLSSLEKQLANLGMSAKDLAVQNARLNAMKFGADATSIQKAADLAAKIYDIKNASIATSDSMGNLNRAFANITHWAGAIGLFSISIDAIPSKLLESAKAVETATSSMAFFAKTQAELAQTNSYVTETAQRLNVSISTYAQSYTRMLTLQDAGIVTQQRGREIMEGMTNAAAALGAGNEQLGQSMYGLAQGLSAGVLRMEELNQITEPLPGLLNQLDIAAQLPAGGFRKLVAEGKVTSEFFSTTLVQALDAYAGAAEAKTNSIAGATTRLENAWYQVGAQLQQPITSVAVAGLDAMSSTVSSLGNGLATLSTHTDDLKIGLAGAGAATLAYTAYTGALGAAMVGAAGSAAALSTALIAIARHPIAIALAGAATAVAVFGGESDKASVDVDALTQSVDTVLGRLDKVKSMQADKALTDIKTAIADINQQINNKSLWDVMFGNGDELRAKTAALLQQRRELIDRQKQLTTHIEKSTQAQKAFNCNGLIIPEGKIAYN